ncbi:MAG TPA: hypothetical protein VMM56_10180 [Planctomycetaceae bacterium]|nr:hypothetical protein [Planctomycetaceae bacterium]
MAIFVAMYLFATGPLLWSYSRFENQTWRSFIKLTMTPIIKLENYHRHSDLGIEMTNRIFSVDLSVEPWWVAGLKAYWDLYGDRPYNDFYEMQDPYY